MSDEERRKERVLKNRVSAMKSLQKKKRYTDDLEKRANLLTAQNIDLKSRIYALVAKLAQAGVHVTPPIPAPPSHDPRYDPRYAAATDALLHSVLAQQPYLAPRAAFPPPRAPAPAAAPTGAPRIGDSFMDITDAADVSLPDDAFDLQLSGA